jgi:hypothetical protein
MPQITVRRRIRPTRLAVIVVRGNQRDLEKATLLRSSALAGRRQPCHAHSDEDAQGQRSILRGIRRSGAALRRGPDGVHIFDQTEIEALARQRPLEDGPRAAASEGELAAAAFALFKKGVDPRDVVIELEQPPGVIKRLLAEWHLMGDRLILGEETMKVLDRMCGARLLDEDILLAIYNDDHEALATWVRAKMDERKRRARDARPRHDRIP